MDIQQEYTSGEKNAALFFDTFFSMCHKFKIDYAKATPKDTAFIDEITRYNYELEKAKRDGLGTEKIKKPFLLANTAENASNFPTEPVALKQAGAFGIIKAVTPLRVKTFMEN